MPENASLWPPSKLPGQGTAACAVAIFLLLATLGRAQDATGVRVESVRLGFDGKYKVGDWTPVWVTLAYPRGKAPIEGRLELTVLDGDGVETTYVDQAGPPVELESGEEAEFLQYVKFGRVRSDLAVRLRGGQGVLAERTFAPAEFPQPLPAGRELIVTLGGEAGVAEAARQTRRRPEEQVAVSVVDRDHPLPDHWRGYDSIDTLVLLTGGPEFLDTVDEPQWAALRQWVRLGGRVLLSVGAQGERVFGEQGVLADFSPGRFVGVAPQQRTAGLETFINAAERLGAGEGRAGGLLAAVLADVRGTVKVAESAGPTQRPMVVHYPVGLGQATLIAVDLDREPLASWRERGKLVRRLLEGFGGGGETAEQTTARGRVSHIGYEDLVGQLRAALDDFPGVTLVAFSWVAALVVLYAALIGPADYFLLRRYVGRMERTWFTFPVVVAVFCLIAWAGVSYFKADRLLVNRVDVVDVDVASRQVRGSSWIHVYSPRGQTYDISLTPQSALATSREGQGTLLTWLGLPGSGLGGMNSAAGRLYNAPYRIVGERENGALRVEPQEMPIQVRSTRALFGRWWAEAELDSAGELAGSPNDGALDGEVVNPLDVPLQGAVLLYNHWAYRMPQEMAPGGGVSLNRRLPDGNLVWRLTQKSVGEDFKEFATPWDEANRDVPRVMEMILWHEAAGGRTYTGLLHRYQGELDLSSHLAAGRAILIGRVAKSPARLSLGGEAPPDDAVQQWTWYRVVLPVREE
ncbi:MAG: hypothetical protein KY475_12710 [Planctomycetes bacterium]|nr:hypothetical protein [Planctomycetota bacterium]